MNRSLIQLFLPLLQRELPLGIPAALSQIRRDELYVVNSKYSLPRSVSSQNVGPENRNLAKIIFIFLKNFSPSRFRSQRVLNDSRSCRIPWPCSAS